MNVILPINNSKDGFYRKIIYIFVLLVCIIAICIAVYFQFYKKENTENPNQNNVNEVDKKQISKDEFNNIFNNELTTDREYNLEKEYEQYDLVFTRYKSDKVEENKYNLNLNIPHINIKQEAIQNYNKKITDIFLEKAKSIMNNENSSNVIYNISYTASIKNNILSFILKANLKEGSNAQRVIIQTYNYDLENNEELTIEKMLSLKQIDINEADKQIKEEIQKAQNQVEELEKLGYTIYTRNPEDDMYKVQNATEFYLDANDNLYIIYAYGNQNATSEMDLVVF